MKREREPRPRTDALMRRVVRIIERSKGAIDRVDLAKFLGKRPQEVVEWVGGWRSAPNSETVLAILEWVQKHEKKSAAAK